MTFKSSLKYARVAPEKARLIADLIRGKKLLDAEAILKYNPTKTSEFLFKLLKSAENIAKDKTDADNLKIKTITVNGGPIIKRRKIRSKGRADLIKKRTSHFTIELVEIKSKKETKKDKESENEKIKEKNGSKNKSKKS